MLESSLTPVGGEDEIPGLPREAPDHNPGIYYEGTLLAYDREENRLYLPQNCGEAEMYGELSAVIQLHRTTFPYTASSVRYNILKN